MTELEKLAARVECPKCGETSGNDWAQCKGRCPMPMSPHFTLRANQGEPK